MAIYRLDIGSLTVGGILGIVIYKLWKKSCELLLEGSYIDYYKQSECLFFTPTKIGCNPDCYLYDSSANATALPCNNCNLQKIIEKLKNTEKSLDICMYLLTSSDISDVLLMLLTRGVFIRIIVDSQMVDEAFGAKMLPLRKGYVPIKLVKTSFMMHNKFAVIDNKLVITGSANWTKQGFSGNYENIAILAHPKIARKYRNKIRKTNDGPHKAEDKTVSPKIFPKSKLPEKTKFTMKYDYLNKTNKHLEQLSSSVSENGALIGKGNLPSRRQGHYGKDAIPNVCPVKSTMSKMYDFRNTKIPRSSASFFLSPGSITKTSTVSDRQTMPAKKVIKHTAIEEEFFDSDSLLLPSKLDPNCVKNIVKSSCRISTEARDKFDLPVLKKSMTRHASVKAVAAESKGECLKWGSHWLSAQNVSNNNMGHSKELNMGSQSEEKRDSVTNTAKERSESMELKRNKSDVNPPKLDNVHKPVLRNYSHDRVLDHLKDVTFDLGLTHANFACNKKGKGTQEFRGSGMYCKSKKNSDMNRRQHTHTSDVKIGKESRKDMPETKISEDKGCETIRGIMDKNSGEPSKNLHQKNHAEFTAQTGHNDESFLSVHTTSNDDFVNLDKRIWNDLELFSRDLSDKTEFSLENDESLSEIIQKVLVPHSEPEVPAKKFETNRRKTDSNKACITKVTPEQITKEEPNKIMLESKPMQAKLNQIKDKLSKLDPKPEKSNENKKSLDVEANGQNNTRELKFSTEEKNTKVPCEQENNDARDDSSPFFKQHRNIGFIGEEVDEEYVSFDVDQMTLYQPHESQMMVYDIANCTAVQAYLEMCGIKYNLKMKKNAEHMSPSGKVPFISSGMCIIPEFEAIVSFMQYKKFTSLQIEECEKSTFRLIMSMLINTLEVAERYICWYDDNTLTNYTKPRIVGHYPFPLNHIIYFKKKIGERRYLADRGASRKSLRTMMTDVNRCLHFLSQQLGNSNFFLGERSSEIDALVYGHMYALLTVVLKNGPFKDIQCSIQQYPNLISFCAKFDKMFLMNNFSENNLIII